MQQLDDEIKILFKDFKPTPTSDADFMARLQKNLSAIEAVKNQVAAMQRRNRIAMVAAAFAGFLMGVLCTLLFPMIADSLGTVSLTIPRVNFPAISIDWQIVGWLLSGTLGILTAVQTYNFILTTAKIPSGK